MGDGRSDDLGDDPGEHGSARSRDSLWRLLFFSAAAILAIGLLTDGWGRGNAGGDLAHSGVVVAGTLIVVAAVMLLLGPALYRRSDDAGTWRVLQVAAPLLVIGLVGPAMVAAASAANRPGRSAVATAAAAAESAPHDHGLAAAGETPVTVQLSPSGDVAPADALAAEIVGGHEHGQAVPEEPIDAATRAELGLQLVASRAAAEAFPTVADAEKAGYTMVTPFVPLIGAHYINFALVDGRFELDKPEMLLFDGTAPESKIVGLSYFVYSPSGAPEGFVGPNDRWHQHIGLCVKDAVVVGGETITEAQCKKRGGRKVGLKSMWMVHAWVVPGWESPQGVFSPEHTGLV